MSWQTKLTWHNAKIKAGIIHNIRTFFHEKHVFEVDTPLLSNGTITDEHLDAFTVPYDYFNDSPLGHSSQLYLQTSPEFAMKRLLASGYGCIYQITKAFRDEAYGRFHNPEFTMLEWYRLGFDHFALMDEVSELLQRIIRCKQPHRMTYQEVFINHTNIDPLKTSNNELIALLQQHNKLSDWLVNESDIDTLLQVIFSELIEPNIGLDAPCFIYNFPRSQASLAKISADDGRVAERFECYYQGIELANGFHELTDVDIQRLRFEQDNAKRVLANKPERPIDENFLLALKSGLPPCAGVALGIDRLLMLTMKEEHIEQVQSFIITDA